MPKELNYSAVFIKDEEGGYSVFVPALPGCHSQGETLVEAKANIIEATELYLETLAVDNEKSPLSTRSRNKKSVSLIQPYNQQR